MKTLRAIPIVPVVIALAIVLSSAQFFAAQTPNKGAIEFSAYVRPSGGPAEPVRQMTFYLLSKSVAEIRKQVESAEPPIDLEHFIAQLSVSAELKAWMSKHQRVDLAGNDFVKELTADDIIAVPEFSSAYSDQNGAAVHAGVPEPKFKPGEEQKDPEKYKRQQEQYRQALLRYIRAHPDLMQGLDAEFRDSNPYPRWMRSQEEYQRRTEQQVMQLAQTQYLVGTAVSDLNGRAAFEGLAPGQYWVSNLDTPALTGDLRLSWDVAVAVTPAKTARVELSNLNTVESVQAAR